MSANTQGFDHFRNGELVPALTGKASTLGFDHWRNGELLPALSGAAAAPTTYNEGGTIVCSTTVSGIALLNLVVSGTNTLSSTVSGTTLSVVAGGGIVALTSGVSAAPLVALQANGLNTLTTTITGDAVVTGPTTYDEGGTITIIFDVSGDAVVIFGPPAPVPPPSVAPDWSAPGRLGSQVVTGASPRASGRMVLASTAAVSRCGSTGANLRRPARPLPCVCPP
jgi:hypothetical protein